MFRSSVQYQDTLQQVTNYFAAQGSSLVQAQQQAIAWIGLQVQLQASFLDYMDAFWVLMLISLAAVSLALMLRRSNSAARRRWRIKQDARLIKKHAVRGRTQYVPRYASVPNPKFA